MLTEEQIERLFYFCTSNGVLYYDVQVELVDHLVNSVEIEMSADPKLTFEKAIEKVHKSFGYKGFEPLVIEKKKMVRKQSRILFWNFFKKQFTWPKMLLFVILTFGFFTIFSMNVWLVKPALLLVLLAGTVPAFYGLYLKKRISKAGYEFLFLDFSAITGLWLQFINLINVLNFLVGINIVRLLTQHQLIPATSIFLSLYIIGIIATFQTITEVKHSLQKNYPNAFSIAQ